MTSCPGRVYRYYFLRREYDTELLKQAVKLLEGEHDFRNFCRIDAVNVCDFTRTIFRGDVILVEKGLDIAMGMMRSRDPSHDVMAVEIIGRALFMASGLQFRLSCQIDSLHHEHSFPHRQRKRADFRHSRLVGHFQESPQAAILDGGTRSRWFSTIAFSRRFLAPVTPRRVAFFENIRSSPFYAADRGEQRGWKIQQRAVQFRRFAVPGGVAGIGQFWRVPTFRLRGAAGACDADAGWGLCGIRGKWGFGGGWEVGWRRCRGRGRIFGNC